MVDLQLIGVLMTGVSVTIAAVYYMFTLRINMKTQQLALKTQEQNLETRQAQLYNNIWNQSLNNLDFQRKYMKLLSLKWDNIEKYKEILPVNDPDSQNTMALWGVALFFQGLAPIIREGLLDIKYIESSAIGGLCGWFWLKLEPIIGEIRDYYGPPDWMSDTEYLYKELKSKNLNRISNAPKS